VTAPAAVDAALVVAGGASLVAALLHLAIIAGGPAWYRFFGAGEGMARAAEKGRWRPALITLAIALVLGAWAAYAFAGAGLFDGLPLVRPALCALTAVYLLRGAVIVPALLMPRGPATGFAIWSSAICLAIGGVHLLGLTQVWSRIA
jgi:hypothetical protein